MNILVTGANGQLGNEMRIVAKGSNDSYIFTDVNQVEGVETVELDITDLEAVRKMVAENQIDVIVNCAAYTNVDAAETNVDLAEKLNAVAPENLAKSIKEVGGLLVQISTDYVFGKEPYNTPCKEDPWDFRPIQCSSDHRRQSRRHNGFRCGRRTSRTERYARLGCTQDTRGSVHNRCHH